MTPRTEFLLFLTAAAPLLCSFVAFDQILRKECREHPAEWEHDGKPIGFFWVPAGGSILRGSSWRSQLMFRWLFLRPEWAKPHADLAKYFWIYRLATGAYFALLVALVSVFFSSGR